MSLHSRTLKVASFIFLFALTFASCKRKKEDTVTLPITGAWESLTDTTYQYLVFKDDNTVTALREGVYNLHSSTVSIYSADAEQVTMAPGGGYSQLYNYRISNDTLYLENVSAYLVFKRSTVNTEGWTKNIVTLETHPLGSGAWFGALDYDGSSFVISSSYAHKLYKVSGTGFTVTDSVAVSQRGSGIACIGSNIWLNDYSGDTKVHTINFATGTATFSSPACAQTPVMLTPQGGNILVFTTDPALYEYNIAGSSFTLKQNLPGLNLSSGGIPPDMVIKDGYAYITVQQYIIKFDLTTYQAVDTYLNPNNDLLVGIAHNGTDFYVLALTIGSSTPDFNVTLRKVQL